MFFNFVSISAHSKFLSFLAEFESPEGKHAALGASVELLKRNFLVCPSLTPPHLLSWAAMTTTTADLDKTTAEVKKTTQEEVTMTTS